MGNPESMEERIAEAKGQREENITQVIPLKAIVIFFYFYFFVFF